MSGRAKKAGGTTWVDRQLIQSHVFIGVCTSGADWRKTAKRLGIEEGEWIPKGANAQCVTVEHPENGTACIVCIAPRGKRTRAAYAALIVHEATHVWQKVRSAMGESAPSSEFEAYSLQSICQNLFEAVGL